MSRGPVTVFGPISIASAATLSSAFDLGAKAFNKISLVVPTMASGTDLTFFACESSSGTFRQVYHSPTVTSGAAAFSIASSVTNCVVPLNNVHVNYLKIRHTTATTDSAYSYYLICSD